MGVFNNLCYGSLATAFALFTAPVEAAFTFLGPSPYLSKADSPFALGAANQDFYLEDFEEPQGCDTSESEFCGGGLFDALGARMLYGSTEQGQSVDADDGVIDGLGSGASAIATPVYFTPNSFFYAIDIEFDAAILGFYPTAVGFVLTDGAGYMSGLSAYDGNGNRQDFSTWGISLDPLATSDDRFVGLTNPNGVSRIVFGKTLLSSDASNPPRIDHLQYGLIVPESFPERPFDLVVIAAVAVVSRFANRINRERIDRYESTEWISPV